MLVQLNDLYCIHLISNCTDVATVIYFFVVMVEGNANEVSEEQFCEAVHLGFKEVLL